MESGSQASAYPVQLSVEYPDRDLDRGTTAFRLIWAIPILILVATIQGDPRQVGRHRDMAARSRSVAQPCSSCLRS